MRRWIFRDHNCVPSDPSRPSVSDGHLLPFHDDRDLTDILREFQHLFQLVLTGFHVHVFRFLTVSRPGSVRVRSSGLSVNDDSVNHDSLLWNILGEPAP